MLCTRPVIKAYQYFITGHHYILLLHFFQHFFLFNITNIQNKAQDHTSPMPPISSQPSILTLIKQHPFWPFQAKINERYASVEHCEVLGSHMAGRRKRRPATPTAL
jgi:hypothetical protein